MTISRMFPPSPYAYRTLSTTERTHNYYRQNGCQKLTPRQMRRLQHKYNRSLAYGWMHGKWVRLTVAKP